MSVYNFEGLPMQSLNNDASYRLLECFENTAWGNNVARTYISRLSEIIKPTFMSYKSWGYPMRGLEVVPGSLARQDVPSVVIPDTYNSTISINKNNKNYAVVCTDIGGQKPYIEYGSAEDLDVYPIPIANNIKKITISVTPNDILINPWFFSFYPTSLRYTDESYNKNPGVLGSGTVEYIISQIDESKNNYLAVILSTPDNREISVERVALTYSAETEVG